MKNIDYAKSPLVKRFIELNSENKSKNHIFLFAGGGYGKTTAMKCLYLYLVNQAKTNNDIVPIYIDVKELNFRKSNPIINYIHSEYSGSDTTESDVENLLKKQAPSFSKKYTYYILIDGLNETNDSNKKSLMDDISDMNNNSSNISFVVSSRVKEDFDWVDFNTFQLKGLDEDKIKKYLDKEFGKRYNENTDVERINKSLIEILKIPMFMNVFSKTYNKKSPYPDIYTDRAVRKADILDSYIQKILKDLKERTSSSDNDILEFVINFYIPALAFQMQKNDNSFSISEVQFKELRANEDYFDSLLVPDEYMDSFVSKKYRIKSICTDNFALLSKSNGYSFVHQIWRDFFAAKHIINCMNAEKLDALEVFIDGNVRLFVGELIREYDDKYKYSKRHEYKQIAINGRIDYVYSPDTRKCECDFEEKDNLNTWSESPIEHFLQENYKELNKRPIAIRNLIEIMKTARNNHITAKYDNLDLQKVKFHGNCSIVNSSFCNSRVYMNNFPDEICQNVDSACFSPDNKTLVLATWSKIYLINLSDDSAEIIEREIHDIGEELYSPGGEMKFSPRGTLLGIHGRDYPNWDLYDIERKEIIKSDISDNEDCKELIKNVSSINKDEFFALSKDISGVKYNRIAYNDSIFSISEKCVLLNGKPFISENFNINSIKLANNGKVLITGNSNGEINVYDISLKPINYKLVEKIDNEESINNLAVSNDCRMISAVSDCSLKIWEKKRSSYFLFSERKITNLKTETNVFHPNNYIYYLKCYSYVENGAIQRAKLQIFNSSTLKTEKIILFNTPILDYCFSDYSEYFAIMLDNRIELWNLNTAEKSIYDISELLRQENSKSLSISFDNNACLSLKNGDLVIKQWEAKSVSVCEKNKEFYRKHFEYGFTTNNYETISQIVLGCDFSKSIFDNEILILLLHYNGAEIPKKYYSNINKLHRKYKNHKRTENYSKSINIPIKKIVDCVESINDCSYEEDEKLLLRRFMIACLNLNYFKENRLFDIVNCFGMRIKQIKNKRIDNLDNYLIKDNILYINKDLMNDSQKKYEICFFKAIAEAIFNPVDVNISIGTVITEMAAEKIYNMDNKNLAVVLPREEYETICGIEMNILTGYDNYNLLICLAKQLFLLKNINENRIIADSFTNGLKSSLYELISDDDSRIYLKALDDEYMFYRNRVESGYEDEKENRLILGYQKKIMNSFTKADESYFAFCATITFRVIQDEAMNKFEDPNTVYENMLKSLEKNKQVKKLFDIFNLSIDDGE